MERHSERGLLKGQSVNRSVNNSSFFIILSGDPLLLAAQIKSAVQDAPLKVMQIDEKSLVKIKSMLRLVRPAQKGDLLCFGCKDLRLQRFQALLQSYLLVARARHRLLIDENGTIVRFSPFRYFLVEIPKFLVEIVASILVVILTYARLVLLRSTLEKKKRQRLKA